MVRPCVFALAACLLVFPACSKAPPPAPARRDAMGQADIDRAALRAELARHRAQQIERLGLYAQKGDFPHNYGDRTPVHIFRDAAARLCAVANLVHQDSRDDLVDKTAREHNDLAIADVHDGPMLDWILGSGLTQEELVRIQLPAPPLARRAVPAVGGTPVAVHVDEARMNIAVVLHVEQVVRELLANRDKSLDTATERLMTARTVAAKPKASGIQSATKTS